jgi:CRISPR-associated protein Cmr4
MNKKLMTIFTISPLHVGAGSSVGVVDLPIMRERHTQIPVIPGSSLKGVLADLWPDDKEQAKGKDTKPRTNNEGKPVMIRNGTAASLFGSDDNDNPKAGALKIGEARAVLFPVRSLKGGFVWTTSPLALGRLARDLKNAPTLPQEPAADRCLSSSDVTIGGSVVLEEYKLTVAGEFPAEWAECLIKLLPEEVQDLAKGRLVLLTEEMFQYFCEKACQVVTRIKVDDEKGTVVDGALFSQEQVPSETLFTTVVHESEKGGLQKLEECLNSAAIGSVLQIGGDESTGLGVCKVRLI